jgi:hypothetical protein
MQKKTRVLSAAMAGSLALAITAITASSGAGLTARHAGGRVMTRLSAVNTPGYDGTDPYQTGCANGAVVVSYSHLWSNYFGNSPGLRDADSLVRLVYSPRCRTVWAVLTGTLYATPEGSGGQAVVIRTSDYHSAICHADIDGNCYTTQLSDAGVTSYAAGNDTLGAGGAVYYGRTRSY